MYIGQNSKITANGSTSFDITTYSSGADIVRLNSPDSSFILNDTTKLSARCYDAGAHLFYSTNSTSETSLIKLAGGIQVSFKNPTNVDAIWTIDDYIEEHIGKNKFIDDLSQWGSITFVDSWPQDSVEIKEDVYVDDRDLSSIKKFMQLCSDAAASMSSIVKDGHYNNIDLLNNGTLVIKNSNDSQSCTEIEGVNIREEVERFTNVDWQKTSDALKYIDDLSNLTQKISNATMYYTNKINIVKVRQNFTEEFSAILEEGADKLLLADMEEESAKMLAIECRQKLAINALSLSANAARNILQLF